VLPPEFEFVNKASDFEGRNQFDVWVPLALNLEKLQRNTVTSKPSASRCYAGVGSFPLITKTRLLSW